MSDLKVRKGQRVTAERHNAIIDRLPGSLQGGPGTLIPRMVLCRTTSTISAAEIDEADTADSIYHVEECETYGLVLQSDGTYKPALTTQKRILLNPSLQEIPSGTELWAIDYADGVLIATIWAC